MEKTLELIADAQQRRINLEFRRLQEQARLIASRTQMRLSLDAYHHSGDPAHLETIQRILKDAINAISDVRGIWIQDESGRVVTHVIPTNSALTGDSLLTPPDRDAPVILRNLDGLAPEIWVLAPLILDGKPLGRLSLLISTDNLRKILSDFRSRDHGGETVLLLRDADARLFAFTATCAGLWEVTPKAVDPLNALLLQQSDTTHLAVSPAGLINAMRPLEIDQARVLVYTSLANIERFTQADRNLLLTVTVSLILLALFIAFFMARIIANPIRVLAEATQQLREGDFKVRVIEHPWGEFALLTQAFNETTAALNEHEAALQAEIDVRQEAEKKLAKLANTDALTGLCNRRHFLDMLYQRVERERRIASGGALLYLDLDEFKPINDQYGHDAGDATLCIVAERLRRAVRERDCVGRLGGDEFAVLLTDCEPGFEPEVVARRIADSLELPMMIKGHHLRISCSLGMADITPDLEPNTLLNQADAAMYRVKQSRQRPSSTTILRERTSSGAGSTVV